MVGGATQQTDDDYKPRELREIDILWITAGLGCDGESVALTAATQPGIDDIMLGNLPGIPKVNFHNPLYAYENADQFMEYLELAGRGQLDPFILVIEGSIPNEEIKAEGYWAAFGTDRESGQPRRTCEWIDCLGW